jgi:transposase-like protein
MVKYRKERSSARTKKRVFELEQPVEGAGRSYVDALARSHIQRGLQDALEAERDEIVGRAWHAHHEEGTPLQYRNGYGDPRCVTCGSGTVEIQMPRLREPYESKIVAKYERLTPEIRELLPQLYLHGLALGDFQQAFGWLWGEDAPLSESSMLRLKGPWEEQYQK